MNLRLLLDDDGGLGSIFAKKKKIHQKRIFGTTVATKTNLVHNIITQD
jgi:hypothetical protein